LLICIFLNKTLSIYALSVGNKSIAASVGLDVEAIGSISAAMLER
jgi:hypothetical protein